VTGAQPFTLSLHADGRLIGTVSGPEAAGPGRSVATEALSVARVRRVDAKVEVAAGARPRMRLRLGPETVAIMPQSFDGLLLDLTPHLRARLGVEALVLEADRDGAWVPAAVLVVTLEGSPELHAVFDAIIADLEAVHVGLARDILAAADRATTPADARIFQPEAERSALEAIYAELAGALSSIGVQPATRLARRTVVTRWRAGDRMDARAAGYLARAGDVAWSDGQPVRVGRVPVLRRDLTTDLEEHRHIRAGLVRLSRRATALATGCYRAASLLREEKERWGRQGPSESVFSQRYLPRVERLEELGREAETLASRFEDLADGVPFLAGLPRPRTRFGPTPVFRGRRGYRQAYGVLSRLFRERSAQVNALELRVRYRSLDVLYEYWTFVKAVEACVDQLGPPTSGTAFQLVDEVYRPDLAPGQSFEWIRITDGTRVRLFYEPDIPPRGGRPGSLPWRAALTNEPLRPDAVLVVERPGAPARALVLDAKNTPHFTRDRLFSVSDYRTLIHEPDTGRQPVRQLFLVHRDANQPLISTLPGYPHGEWPGWDTSVLGAVALTPGEETALRQVVVRFLALAM
jgi:hypothetical protein